MREKFAAGDSGTFNSIDWRVSAGRKEARLAGAEDLRLDIRTPGGQWRAVPMHLGFLMADVFFQVEETLYPQSQGWQGGNRYLAFVRRAVEVGYREVTAELDAERARKRAAA